MSHFLVKGAKTHIVLPSFKKYNIKRAGWSKRVWSTTAEYCEDFIWLAALLVFGKSFLMWANRCCSIESWRLSGVWREWKLSLHCALSAGGTAEVQEVLKLWELGVVPMGALGDIPVDKPPGQPGLCWRS